MFFYYRRCESGTISPNKSTKLFIKNVYILSKVKVGVFVLIYTEKTKIELTFN